MNHMFSIGDIARLLNVPTATLRFWEEKGLFTVEKGKNRYRRYNVRNLAEIADVIFFRNLGIPVSRVGAMGSSTLEEYACHLQDTQDQLKEKIQTYSQMYGRTEQQLLHLQEVRALMQCTFQLEEVPFCAVYAFDYGERTSCCAIPRTPPAMSATLIRGICPRKCGASSCRLTRPADRFCGKKAPIPAL